MVFLYLQLLQIEKVKLIHHLLQLNQVQSKNINLFNTKFQLNYSFSDISTMDEDDLVSYRQHTTNTTGGNRGGKKRPASPPLRTTTNQFDIDEDYTSTNPKQRVIWF
jgi:hypothetical protein